MRRSSSRSKWKDVLGFDDGCDPRGDQAYSYTPGPRPRAASAPHPDSSRRFPRGITFYRSKNDLLLRPFSPAHLPGEKPLPDPPPIFYVTLQRDPSPAIATSRPDIVLHSGSSRSSRILSFAKFHTVTQSTEITICPGVHTSPTASSIGSSPASSSFSKPGLVLGRDNSNRPKFRIVKLSPTGGILTREKHAFSHVLPGAFVPEKFEWRQTSRTFVRNLDGGNEGNGLKLVRTRTNETIVVYAGLGKGDGRGEAGKVLGTLKFVGQDGGPNLGEDFEVLAVMSILSVVERARRAAKANFEALGMN